MLITLNNSHQKFISLKITRGEFMLRLCFLLTFYFGLLFLFCLSKCNELHPLFHNFTIFSLKFYLYALLSLNKLKLL